MSNDQGTPNKKDQQLEAFRYDSMKGFTKAKFLQDPSIKTPVFVRCSTVAGQIWPEEEVPMKIIGKMTLNRNVDNVCICIRRGDKSPLFFVFW